MHLGIQSLDVQNEEVPVLQALLSAFVPKRFQPTVTIADAFIEQTLLRLKNGFGLYLQIWPADRVRRDTPQEVASWCIGMPLVGRFAERRYIARDVGERYTVLRPCLDQDGRSIGLREVGVGYLRSIAMVSHARFVPFTFASGDIRSFYPEQPGFALTLVFSGTTSLVPRTWVKIWSVN